MKEITEDWIEVNIPFGPAYDSGEQLDSLDKRGLCTAGTLVKLDTGEEFLIGDVNRNGGGCDCCPTVGYRDTVAYYKIVWSA